MTTTRKRPVRFVLSTAQLLLPVALVTLCAGPARAEEAPPGPWHEGVSEERKQRAQALFEEARELHRRAMLAEARAKYEEALAAWEQPELRLYLGRVLKLMGLPLPAHENLRLALRWGPGSLDAEKEQEARAAMRALAERELAAIRIRCDEPGAVVLMDGQPWFIGPGAERRMVMPGEHVITAKKNGYFTVVKPILVIVGKEASGQIALSADTVVSGPRWATWLPWATLGAGAALGIAGGALMRHAAAAEEATDQRLEARCLPSCKPFTSDTYDGTHLENGLGIGALLVGGAAVITGTVLLFVNGPEAYRTPDRGGVKIELRPAASPDAAALSARLVF